MNDTKSGTPAIQPFPITPLAMLREGVAGFRRQPLLLLAGGVLTFAAYAAFRIPAQAALEEGRRALAIGLDLFGAVVAATLAYPWFSYALSAARDEPTSWVAPLRVSGRFFAQLVAAFWFWAAVMLGLRYLAGIPAILAGIFYAFYGYVVVDRPDLGGMKALGTSVRLGDKRRIALFAILGLFGMFNLLALLPMGYGVNPVSIIVSIVLLLITTSITMVAGAALYDTLKVDLSDA